MEDVLLKRAEAIDEVKWKLEVYADIMINGYAPIMDRIPSFTTSILAMPENGGSGKSLGEKVTNAMMDELEEKSFVQEYSAIISSLNSYQKEIIVNRYFKKLKIRDFEIGNQHQAGDKRIYIKLNDIYAIIACMDDDIEFSFDDYVKAKVEDTRIKYEKNKINKIKEQTLEYIRFLLFQSKESSKTKVCMEIIKIIPEPGQTLLLDYIKNNNQHFTSYEYRKIARAIYTFAYLHPDFDMDEELYNTVLRRSGNGWKKYKEEIIIQFFTLTCRR